MTLFLTYIAVGALVGVLAGLLGIGGGMTLVPILSAIFQQQSFATDHIVHLALGTAMASIVFTSAASVRQHHKLGGVDFSIAKRLAPGMVLGTFASTLASGWIAQRHLALAFSFIVFIGATQILLNKKPAASRSLPGPVALFLLAGAIGVICGLVSAGGAFLTVPLLLWCGVPILTAIGTAALLGFPLAIIGSIGHMISGWQMPHLPPDAIGFVSTIALAGLVTGSVVTAPYGARLAHRLPTLLLKRIFAVILYILAAKMLATYW